MARTSVPTARPASYSLAQIVLHWSIAALVIWQLFFSEHPPRAAARLGPALGLEPDLGIEPCLARPGGPGPGRRPGRRCGWRSAPRRRSKPTGFRRLAAQAVHFLFYFLLFFMPVTGILAWYFGLPTGGIHELGQPVFIGLIVAHVAAVAVAPVRQA